MKIIKPKVELEFITPNALKFIEKIGRTCYCSFDKITEESAEKFCKMIKTRNHMSVLEHASATFRLTTDRGVTHEVVRHRIASYSQESTRYIDYNKKFGANFIEPAWIINSEYSITDDMINRIENTQYTVKHILNDDTIDNITKQIYVFILACYQSEQNYNAMINLGATPQNARAVLINALKTELVMTANFREWLHFLDLRTSTAAHPDMRIIANQIGNILNSKYPIIFEQTFAQE